MNSEKYEFYYFGLFVTDHFFFLPTTNSEVTVNFSLIFMNKFTSYVFNIPYSVFIKHFFRIVDCQIKIVNKMRSIVHDIIP